MANGAKVYISSRDAKACDSTASRLTSSGPGTCHAIPADLSSYDECIRLADEIKKREPVLNVLVNNSGTMWSAPLEEYPDEAFSQLMTLNVQRVFTITQALLPYLQKGSERDGVGRVINIGSVNGVNAPSLETFAYSASKAALHMLTKHLAGFIGPGVNINALALGAFRSDMMKATLDAAEDVVKSVLPLQRIGEPSDVGAACLWLAGKGGSFVTGAIIPVDGGSLVSMKARK